MDLTVSIISHNNRDMLRDCLASIFADPTNHIACGAATELTADSIDIEIIAVVNLPGDGTAEMLRSQFPAVRIIENESPCGFSTNHNRALHDASSQYIAVLNDDATLHPGCLRTLVKLLKNTPDAAAAGPRTLNPDGSLQVSCYRLPSLTVLISDAFFLGSLFPHSLPLAGYKRWRHDRLRPVQNIIGACMVFPRDIFRAAGGFDESFFLYFEEADLCKRIQTGGKKIYFTPDASITHHGGASISRLGPAEIHHFYTGMNIYFAKHFGRASLFAVYALNIFGAAVRLAAYAALSPISNAFRDRTDKQRVRYAAILRWYLRSLSRRAK